jgi:hypothetical protein
MKFTREELDVLRASLAEAIVSGIRGDNLGPLTEYRPGKRDGFVELDEAATAAKVAVARATLAKLLKGRWGVATMDAGITAAKATRAKALAEAGFCTPVRRTRRGRLYEYASESSAVWIGRVEDLLAEGFELLPEDRFR